MGSIRLTKLMSEASTKGNMYEPKRIKAYYEALCRSEGIKPLPVKFERVGYGGAATTYNSKTMKPLYISFDVNRLMDPEFAIIHELSHQIKLETEGDAYTGKRDQLAKFKKLENHLIDKYVYSKYSKLLYEMNEVAYEGNLGFHEMFLFYNKANDSQINQLENLIKSKKFKEAWKFVQRITGVKLKGKF